MENEFEKGFMAGFLINYHKESESTDWPLLPDPKENEVILLIKPSEKKHKVSLYIEHAYDDSSEKVPGYIATVNWGDGEVTSITELPADARGNYDKIYHEYTEEYYNKFLFIKLYSPIGHYTTSNGDRERHYVSFIGFYDTSTEYISACYAACVGKKVYTIENYRTFDPIYTRFLIDDFNETTMTTYIHDYENPDTGQIYSGEYRGTLCTYINRNTKRVDFMTPPEVIYGYIAQYAHALTEVNGLERLKNVNYNSFWYHIYCMKKLNLPEIEEIKSNTFCDAYSLRELYAPKCKKIGADALSNAYTLEKITVAKDCEIASTAFKYCDFPFEIIYAETEE